MENQGIEIVESNSDDDESLADGPFQVKAPLSEEAGYLAKVPPMVEEFPLPLPLPKPPRFYRPPSNHTASEGSVSSFQTSRPASTGIAFRLNEEDEFDASLL
jgi:hypothetical protein